MSPVKQNKRVKRKKSYNGKTYLRRPYSRVLIPEGEGKGFSAYILEFPGCYAQGDTLEEAYQNLEDTAESWIISALAQGQKIPLPVISSHLRQGRN